MTKEAEHNMSKLGHKRNTVYLALKELIKNKDISKLRRGQYQVENRKFTVQETIVV